MTQKWIANFFNPVEAYTDIRRTGYPTLLPQNITYAQSPYKTSQDPELGPVNIPLKRYQCFSESNVYPSSEVTRNPNVTNEGRNLSNPILFWDK